MTTSQSSVESLNSELGFEPICRALGATVTGLDLSKPIVGKARQALKDAFRKYRLLLVRAPGLDADGQAEFARVFGDIVIRQDYDVGPSKDADTQYVSNARDDGILGEGELEFHCDQLFQDEPLKALILYALEVPDAGGETSFINTTLAYNAMPDDLKQRVQNRSCFHLYDFKGNYTGFQDPETASPGSPRANHR